MNKLLFLNNFIKNPKMVGAVLPSSYRLAEKMIRNIDFNRARCIVEYGPGTGVFTKEIVLRKNKETFFLVFELNGEFYEKLAKDLAGEERVLIFNDSVENMDLYLKSYGFTEVDYIISGLPFTVFSRQVTEKIFAKTADALHKEGQFVIFQYSLYLYKFLKKYFTLKTCFEPVNIPPAFVFYCSKKIA
ncbi:class I SAM-dependent methyltransferase [Desulfolucanica intricata]|uniref:class I SAM-dependent methyltransferase n=1 Tax=Desulfolucanica intricata TaxID=1285191 RepID=UPI00082F7D5D|nr:rRNA adenine N-6-methyltransferase family protein [Desulfolucanica intricata]